MDFAQQGQGRIIHTEVQCMEQKKTKTLFLLPFLNEFADPLN